MKVSITVAVLGALAAAAVFPASAQTRAPANTEARAPWQSGFWGYTGLNIGRSDYNVGCGGSSCDNNANTAKLYFGGRFNNMFGLEVGYVNMGKASFAAGDVEAHGLNISLLGGVPIGTNSSIFGKIGTTAGRTKISGTIPAVQTGSEDGWGMSYGLGGQIGLSRDWALRLDADRYDFKFINQGTKHVDTMTVGLQYSFR